MLKIVYLLCMVVVTYAESAQKKESYDLFSYHSEYSFEKTYSAADHLPVNLNISRYKRKIILVALACLEPEKYCLKVSVFKNFKDFDISQSRLYKEINGFTSRFPQYRQYLTILLPALPGEYCLEKKLETDSGRLEAIYNALRPSFVYSEPLYARYCPYVDNDPIDRVWLQEEPDVKIVLDLSNLTIHYTSVRHHVESGLFRLNRACIAPLNVAEPSILVEVPSNQ